MNMKNTKQLKRINQSVIVMKKKSHENLKATLLYTEDNAELEDNCYHLVMAGLLSE